MISKKQNSLNDDKSFRVWINRKLLWNKKPTLSPPPKIFKQAG